MLATRRITLLFVALAALLSAACTENPVGLKCFIGEVGADAGTSAQSIVASPALECPSRTCLRTPLPTGKVLPEGSEHADLCTAECSSNDDCDKVPESPCVNGFACAIPVVTGPFCCRKMCICKDYLLIPDGGIPTPAACEASDMQNKCCNLPGRSGEPGCQ